MSKLSNALHAVFGFAKANSANVEDKAKAILDKANNDVAELRAKVQADAVVAARSKAAADLKAALDLVSKAVQAHIAEAPPPASPPAAPTGTTGPSV